MIDKHIEATVTNQSLEALLGSQVETFLRNREPGLTAEEVSVLMVITMNAINELLGENPFPIEEEDVHMPWAMKLLEALARQVMETEALRLQLAFIQNQSGLLEKLMFFSRNCILILGQSPEREWRIIMDNPAAANLFKYKAISVDPRDLFSDWEELLERVQEAGGMFETAVTVNKFGKGKTSQASLEATFILLNNKRGSYLGMLGRDLTPELERTRLIADMSHDLKTPLTSIQLFIDLMRKKVEKELTPESNLSKDLLQKTENINFQVGRMMKLLASLLHIYEVEEAVITFSPESLNLSHLLRKLLIQAELLAEQKKLTFVSEVEPNIECLGDEALLFRAIENLVNNAIKYTLEGEVKVTAKIHQNEVIIMVADTGIGITTEDLDHIFEKQYRTSEAKEKFEGTGLGLNIVHTIIALHKGRVEVESRHGKGTTFTICLPLHT